MSRARKLTVLLTSLSVLLPAALLAAPAGADTPQWRLAQPAPPEAGAGVSGSQTPVGLGRIGDIEFRAPNLGCSPPMGTAARFHRGSGSTTARAGTSSPKYAVHRRAHRMGGTG